MQERIFNGAYWRPCHLRFLKNMPLTANRFTSVSLALVSLAITTIKPLLYVSNS